MNWLMVIIFIVAFHAHAQTVKTYRSVAEMDSKTPARDEQISEVSGYYTNGDWDSIRQYLYDRTNSLATNAAIRPVPGGIGRRVLLNWDGNARVFGAKGDGTTDDAAALTSAIAQCKVKKIKLYLPAGTYKTTATLDCRNSSDNAMEFPGIRGDGLTLTQIIAYHNDPIIQLQGRGGEYSGFRLGYDSVRTTSTANAVTGYGFVYYQSFRDLEIVNGYRGLFSDTASSSSFFSCSFDNVIIRSCSYANGDIQSSSGSSFNNIYLSNPGSASTEFLWQDRAGTSEYRQLNLEHSNFRQFAAKFRGDGPTIGKLHIEGLRPVTDANFIDIAGTGTSIGSIDFINNFSSGHLLSGITSNGVATIETLGHAVTGGHGFLVGDTVTIGGATPSGYNGSFAISAVTSSNFTYSPTGSPGVNASTNWAAGSDCLWAYVGSFPSPALFATGTYGSGKPRVGTVTMRNNKVLGNTVAIRSGWANLLAREFGGKRFDLSVDTITQGSQYRVGDQVLGFVPIIASSVTSSVATAYLKYPHEMQQGQYVSVSGGVNLSFGSNYWQIASVPDRYSMTFASSASNAGLTVESANMIPVKARVTFRQRSDNKATLTTDVAHNLSVGARVLIRSMSDSSYSKSEALVDSVPTTTSLSYVAIGSNESSTAESNGIIYEFSSGLNAQLQSSSTVGLRKAGDYFEPCITVPLHVLTANSSTTMVYSVSGVRPNARVFVTPFDASTITLGTRYYGGVVSNDYVNIYSENLTSGTVTNAVRLLKLSISP